MAKPPLRVDSITHDEATRKNAPTAELEAFVPVAVKTPVQVAYERRNPDLDPQLVWRGKDVADWSDLVVEAPPLYIQEKIHPKALIEDLKRNAKRRADPEPMADLFADFNGVAPEARTEFYAHDQHWSNRMILGDGLKVMASLAEREGLKGKVQCIYIDPPYGIKFNSNFQWSTTSRDVKDGKADHLTREPEQVKAFRDTWRDGIHSYLTYLRDRLTVARDLLTESGSVFVQIGDENVHRVRALMDEIFGDENAVSIIKYRKTSSLGGAFLDDPYDYIVWYARNKDNLKFRRILQEKELDGLGGGQYRYFMDAAGERTDQAESQVAFRYGDMTSQSASATTLFPFELRGKVFPIPKKGGWKTNLSGMERLSKANRIAGLGNTLSYVRRFDDFLAMPIDAAWNDTVTSGFAEPKIYVVQTMPRAVARCILMTTDPGDLVLDPTCGSGTTAYVAEQWGRRWITVDTSRVALALARARIMGARYPWYLLADSPEGQRKEAEVTRLPPATTSTHNRIRQGFVYKRVPHIMLKDIANNAEIDTIWESYQPRLEALRLQLNDVMAKNWQEWTIPREAFDRWPASDAEYLKRILVQISDADARSALLSLNTSRGTAFTLDSVPEEPIDPWPSAAIALHTQWWDLRIARQKEIDASIAAKADPEYLYDQPYDDKVRVRVAGPFTVESLSPHRVPAVDVDDSLFDELEAAEGRRQKDEVGGGEAADFVAMVLENLKKSGVQQAHKADRLVFSTIAVWPGRYLVAQGQAQQSSDEEGAPQRRVAIFVGPEYGTVSRADLTAAAREAMEAGFDLLVAAAFNFDAHASEFGSMGALTVLQARINPDLHMPDLANTGAGNLFTVFGEPDILVHDEGDGCVSIEVAGIDMYKGGQIESGSADDIAVWFLDTDYNYESFFVRHAYFPGANDPYKALKTTLKAEIDAEAWESLKRTRSRPFARPEGGRVAVKVINHLGDEVMKVVEV